MTIQWRLGQVRKSLIKSSFAGLLAVPVAYCKAIGFQSLLAGKPLVGRAVRPLLRLLLHGSGIKASIISRSSENR